MNILPPFFFLCCVSTQKLVYIICTNLAVKKMPPCHVTCRVFLLPSLSSSRHPPSSSHPAPFVLLPASSLCLPPHLIQLRPPSSESFYSQSSCQSSSLPTPPNPNLNNGLPPPYTALAPPPVSRRCRRHPNPRSRPTQSEAPWVTRSLFHTTCCAEEFPKENGGVIVCIADFSIEKTVTKAWLFQDMGTQVNMVN
jgi:hypothetical protein